MNRRSFLNSAVGAAVAAAIGTTAGATVKQPIFKQSPFPTLGDWIVESDEVAAQWIIEHAKPGSHWLIVAPTHERADSMRGEIQAAFLTSDTWPGDWCHVDKTGVIRIYRRDFAPQLEIRIISVAGRHGKTGQCIITRRTT